MLFDRFKTKKEYLDNQIIAPISGKIIPLSEIKDMTFREELMGQTIAIHPECDYTTLYAPANGTLEVMFPTGHAYAIRMNNGIGLLIHIGIDTVKLKGKGFKVLVDKGEQVKAGQPIVKVDFDYLNDKNYDYSVMMIVTDSKERLLYKCKNYMKAKEIIAEL